MSLRVLAAVVATLVSTPGPARAERPITEVDVYRDMANFWILAGHERSLLVSAGAGYLRDGLTTLDVAYRPDVFTGALELLPNTVGLSAITRPADGDPLTLGAALGYTSVLGLFAGPYVTVNALVQWAPGSSAVDAGFDLGVGYEHRVSLDWSITADVRATRLWGVSSGDRPMDDATSPWGGRATIGVRRYLGIDKATI